MRRLSVLQGACHGVERQQERHQAPQGMSRINISLDLTPPPNDCNSIYAVCSSYAQAIYAGLLPAPYQCLTDALPVPYRCLTSALPLTLLLPSLASIRLRDAKDKHVEAKPAQDVPSLGTDQILERILQSLQHDPVLA